MGIMAGVGGGAIELTSRGLENSRIHRYWDIGLFFHSALTLQYRFDEGIFGRLAVGMEAILAPHTPTECSYADGTTCSDAGIDAEHLELARSSLGRPHHRLRLRPLGELVP